MDAVGRPAKHRHDPGSQGIGGQHDPGIKPTLFGQVEVRAEAQGFKVFEARKGGDARRGGEARKAGGEQVGRVARA